MAEYSFSLLRSRFENFFFNTLLTRKSYYSLIFAGMHKYTAILFFNMLYAFSARAQTVDSMYVHLYTDSLKKGTYNYINIDGLLSNGRYMPLDSSQVIFACSAGKFFGNSLWLDPNCLQDKITITAVLKNNPALRKEFVMYVKKKPDGELKTEREVMEELKKANKKGKG